jgi:hypothetical protein
VREGGGGGVSHAWETREFGGIRQIERTRKAKGRRSIDKSTRKHEGQGKGSNVCVQVNSFVFLPPSTQANAEANVNTHAR